MIVNPRGSEEYPTRATCREALQGRWGPPSKHLGKNYGGLSPWLEDSGSHTRMTIKSLILHNFVMFLQFFLSFLCFFDHFGLSWFWSLCDCCENLSFFSFYRFRETLSFFSFFREILLRRALCRKGRERKETKGKEGRKERRKQRKERKVSKKSDMEKKPSKTWQAKQKAITKTNRKTKK